MANPSGPAGGEASCPVCGTRLPPGVRVCAACASAGQGAPPRLATVKPNPPTGDFDFTCVLSEEDKAQVASAAAARPAAPAPPSPSAPPARSAPRTPAAIPLPPDPILPLHAVIDGKYEILQQLGSGGFGDVYRVKHQLLGREFALKKLRPELAANPNVRERFLREARVLLDLDHPHLVKLRDVGQWRTDLYLVMDLCPGMPLSNLLGDTRCLATSVAVSLAFQVLEALEYTHARGVIHRDLKPANLLVDREAPGAWGVMILDFGVAKVIEVETAQGRNLAEETGEGLMLGTLSYMSPEQAQGDPVDARTDLYALGVVLYQMVTGRLPFVADNPTRLLRQIYQDPPPPLGTAEEAMPGLEDVLFRVLAKKPEQRPATARAMREMLERLLPRLGRPATSVLPPAPGRAPGATAPGTARATRVVPAPPTPAGTATRTPVPPSASSPHDTTATVARRPSPPTTVITKITKTTRRRALWRRLAVGLFLPVLLGGGGAWAWLHRDWFLPPPPELKGLTVIGRNEAGVPEYRHERTGIVFALLPAGEFPMGSPPEETGRVAHETLHQVRISKPFLLGRAEVTNAQFRRFRPAHSSGALFDAPDQPVVLVSWDDATAFCVWAGTRLPTEAEWEYAARGEFVERRTPGAPRHVFPWGSDWPPVANAVNIAPASPDSGRPCTMPAGTWPANGFGLLDMAGNVAEWCRDGYGEYRISDLAVDPPGPPSAIARVVRGGSWQSRWQDLRCAARCWGATDRRDTATGFRVALDVPTR